MVTAFHDDGSVDLAGTAAVAEHLVAHGHDGVVVSGTTGESPTTSTEEDGAILRAVVEAVGDRAKVLAGVGTNNTSHSVELAAQAEKIGADGVLLVSPYYNKPTQPGLVAHFTAVADATPLPVMLYDIPARTGLPIATETLLRLAAHPRIAAVKDAKGDLWSATRVLAETDLLWFSGDDVATLAHLTQGATGYVGVATHVAGAEYASMLAAVDAGDLATAVGLHRRLIPVVDAIMNTSQGAIMAKAALKELGVLDSAAVRLPLVESPPEHLEKLRAALATLKDPISS
jgi:4-hydroxy-tetrahydrodipicolinate synthase